MWSGLQYLQEYSYHYLFPLRFRDKNIITIFTGGTIKNLFLLSLTFILTLFLPPLNAQMQIGPKAGLNIANTVADGAQFFSQDLDSKTGFTGGIFFIN